jgi:antitoxin component YwqK of YwqJK toxin-antitoxin module
MATEHLTEGQIIDGKKEGYWVTYYANGNKRSEGAYKNGQKEGKWLQYHQNGNKQSESSFQDGKYEGYYVSYHKNGEKFREGDYGMHQGNSYDGRKEGAWYQYDETGNINTKVVYKHGRVVKRVNEPPFDSE